MDGLVVVGKKIRGREKGVKVCVIFIFFGVIDWRSDN